MAYVFAEFGTVACGPGMGGNCPPTCPPGYVYTASPGTGGLVFSCDPPSPDTQGNCPSGFSLRVSETRSGTFKTCRSVQPPTCLPGTKLHNDGERCTSVIQEPRNQADCPSETFFTPRRDYPGTRMIPSPARCSRTPLSTVFPGLPGFAFPGFQPPIPPASPPAAPPVIGTQIIATTFCPPGYTLQNGRCYPPRPAEGKCPAGFVYQPAIQGGYAAPGSGISPSPGFAASCKPLQTEKDCQTGYRLVQQQYPYCAQTSAPDTTVPSITKSGAMDWASDNWKWLAALAVVGVVGYGWAKRKPVEE